MLQLLERGITSAEEIASHLNVSEDRIVKYINVLRRKKEKEEKLNRLASLNTYRWARLLRKELTRRVGSSTDDLYFPVTQALHNAADSLPEADPLSFTLANMYRYIAGAGLGCPTQSTELMDCLFTFFKERLKEKLEAAPSRGEIIEYLTRKAEEIANFAQIEEPSRVYWSGQGRPPPGYCAEAYEKNCTSNAEEEFVNQDKRQVLHALALINPLDVPEELLRKLSEDLSRTSKNEPTEQGHSAGFST